MILVNCPLLSVIEMHKIKGNGMKNYKIAGDRGWTLKEVLADLLSIFLWYNLKKKKEKKTKQTNKA